MTGPHAGAVGIPEVAAGSYVDGVMLPATGKEHMEGIRVSWNGK